MCCGKVLVDSTCCARVDLGKMQAASRGARILLWLTEARSTRRERPVPAGLHPQQRRPPRGTNIKMPLHPSSRLLHTRPQPCARLLRFKPASRTHVPRTHSHSSCNAPSPAQLNPLVAKDDGAIVTQILENIKDTDNGLDISSATRSIVDGLLDVLEREGAKQQPRPLENNPLLFGDYNVAYTSSARSSDRGERECPRPAGRWLAGWLPGWPDGWLAAWLAGCLAGCLAAWLLPATPHPCGARRPCPRRRPPAPPPLHRAAAGGRFRGKVGRSLFRTAGLYQSVIAPDIVTNKIEFRLLGLIPGSVGLRGKVLPIGERGDTCKVRA
jgi:hypothetical protein